MVEREPELIDKQMTTILDQYSKELIEGDDRGDDLLLEHGEEFPALAELFSIARRLRETLIPVQPDKAFVAELRTRLTTIDAKDGRAVTGWLRVRNRLSRHSTALGMAISVLAVVVMTFRVVGSLIMVVVLLSGSRRRRTVTA